MSAQISFPTAAGNSKFSFQVQNVKNAPSTQQTSAFYNIRATDKDGNEISRLDTTGPTVKNSQPAIATGNLVQDDTNTGASTPYTITYTTKNKMGSNPSFKIEYPDIITVPSTLSTCQATYGATLTMNCQVNTASRTILVTAGASGGLPGPIPESSKVVIKIAPITNPKVQYNPVTQTPSLRLTSYFTDGGSDYLYDQVNTNLSPGFKCTYPCATCTTATSCSTCYTTISTVAEKYLYNNNCLRTCPDGFYPDSNFNCRACPSNCKTCSDATTCTSCNTDATSQFKYLNGTQCYAKCPDGYFGDANFQCQKCNANCQTCGGSATNCTSCVQGSGFSFLSKSQCVSKCDNGFTSVNFICTACKAPCATCATTISTCMSCITGFLLGTECRTTCPSGYTTDNKRCIGCDPRCEKCSPTDATRCLQCQSPLVLLNNTCISKCPDGYKLDDQKIVCQQIQYIPGGGGGGFGYGNGSYIDGQDLWESNTPNASVYFTTQIAQTVAGGAAYGKYLRDPISSPWRSNMIGLWSPIETLCFAGQAYLSYDQLSKLQMKNFTDAGNSSNSTNSTITKRRILLEIQQALTESTDGIIPLVFYGTCFSLLVNFLCNFVFAFYFLIIMRQDAGYRNWASMHKCHPISFVFFGTLFSFKFHKFFFTAFWGNNAEIDFDNPERIHRFFNILTTLNLIFVLTPVILIDVYGISKYKWGSQFYVMMIETLIFSLTMIAIQIYEIRKPRAEGSKNQYGGLEDLSDQINDEVNKRLAAALEEYARKLKADRDKNLRRTKSMTDLGDREKEEDPRRVNTDPLDNKKKKNYEDRMNPYHQVLDHDYPDNCYAEVGRNLQAAQNPQGKVQQTGQRVLSADEYDHDYENRMRMLNTANLRNDQRLYGVNQTDDEENPMPYKKRKNMRGRKGKYYSQVDDEDQTFLEQERRLIDGKIDEYDDEDDEESKLAAIEEESQSSMRKEDDKTKLLKKSKNQSAAPPGGKKVISPRDTDKSPPKGDKKGKVGAIPEEAEEHEDELIPKKKTNVGSSKDAKSGKSVKQSQESLKKKQTKVVNEADLNASGDDIVDQNEVVMNTRLKQVSPRQGVDGSNVQGADGDLRKSYSRLKSTEDIRKEIEKMGKKLEEEQKAAIPEQEGETSQSDAEKGQPDSDSEEDKRLENMRDPEKRRFNVNDILGDFDRDERGHPLILQDKKGELIDKAGKRVNEKGYLVDPRTGDILEKEKGRKVFSSDELDERGELPPPFNLERYNFNAHDVRGYFDRDPKTGEEIMKNLKRDPQGFLLDKLGRRVNEHGYLVDQFGNLADKRLRTKLHKHIMEQNGGEVPQLFTYKGKKFDLQDVMGHLDKDRKGNIIIRRDAKGNMVDKKGRLVNGKGYLVDADGNVINKDGKVMFENFTLTQDGEIPKLFPFLKFNIDEVKGDYEMDPLGNPMLQKTRDGSLVDSKGRRVNEKGYLIDNNGNVINKQGGVVFNKRLLEDDGEIPKVFRAGLLRKDTYDSFSQLMSEIEDLERLQEMGENPADPRMQEKMRKRMEKENQRMQKKIDQIVEGEGDEDEGMLMKELEELAKGGNDAPGGPNDGVRNAGRMSDGGNTSVDSMMEDTPSNYNALNQRFMEVENVKNKARQNMGRQQQVEENEEEDAEGSEYSYLPDRRMKKKKKKKKKKKRQDQTIDERELMMAKAYGGLTQNQYDKLVALRKLQQSQLPGAARIDTAHSMAQRTPSNLQSALQAQRFSKVGPGNETLSRFNEDQKSEWGDSQAEGGRIIYQNQGRPPVAEKNASRQKNMGSSTSKIVIANKPAFRSNNLMGSTQRSHAGDGSDDAMENIAGPNFNPGLPSQRNFKNMKSKGLIDQQQLANVANSVSGFYKDHGGASDHQSNMSRTQDNFASNINNNRRSLMQGPNGEGMMQGSPRDGDMPRIGTAKGETLPGGYGGGIMLGPNGMPMLGDDDSEGEGWEGQSYRSGRSQQSRFSQVNHRKIKGLETVYLQRLEPAGKDKKKQSKSKQPTYRVMHHKFHDDPAWHVEDRDELDSIMSGNYKEMQKKFNEEFGGSSKGKGGVSSRDGGSGFQGKLRQFKEISK